MSRSTDPGHFFQTDASEATRARRAAKSGNENGNPIKLQSKILDVIVDPVSKDCVYIAESAGTIRRVNIKTRDIKTAVYRGPSAPLTSVAIEANETHKVFAGCWDKDIWVWETQNWVARDRYKGHSDFVKAVVSVRLSGKNCLISGGADSKIMVWDTEDGRRLHTLRDKNDTMRAVQYLAIDPVDSTSDEVILVSASSDPKIRRWRISLSSASQIFEEEFSSISGSLTSQDAIHEHETSVYKLFFDSDEGDIWTASADGTAKCLSRAKKWAAEETIQHGDYVRAVGVTDDWIITAGRDEDVKVWDRSTGTLFHTYQGHFEEVTGLVIIEDGKAVVTVSIDGTIRTWPLERAALNKAIIDREDKVKGLEKDVQTNVKKGLLTEEEEAELAELMDSD